MPWKGFSLIELLVTIGIVSVLLAIAIPALGWTRAIALDTVCRNNLRQVFQAQQGYAVDHRRFTPVWSEADPISWRTRLQQELSGEGDVFHCPEVDNAGAERDGLPDGAVANASYGLNGVMQFDGWNFRPSRVPNPAQIIAIAEQSPTSFENALTADSFGVWSSGGFTNWFRAEDHHPAAGYRHADDGANVAMMDGSVGRLNHAQLYRDAGHWYWFDALANDTASGSGDGEGDYQMPDTIMPSPVPTGPGGTPVSDDPSGPLVAPCGCTYPAP